MGKGGLHRQDKKEANLKTKEFDFSLDEPTYRYRDITHRGREVE